MSKLDNGQLQKIYKEYNRLSELLTYQEVLLDKKLFLNIEKKRNEIMPIAELYNKYLQEKTNLATILEFDGGFEEEKTTTISNINAMEQQLQKLLNERDATIESIDLYIISEKNSERLTDFVKSAYVKFCENNAFEVSCATGGDTTILTIVGLGVKKTFESVKGLHSGLGGKLKIVVIPTVKSGEYDEKDVKITTCRSSGAGGQHINTTDSAIKSTHLPTGISVICQDERSQFQNKEKALNNLREKVEAYYSDQKNTQIETQKKKQLKDINLNKSVRIYDLDKGVIADDEIFRIKDFVNGEII